MRRSIGATSSPGGRRPPVHSMVSGGRPRRPSSASSRARPLAKDVSSSGANRPEASIDRRRFQTAAAIRSCPGREARASAGPGKARVPSAVPSSVMVVRSSGTESVDVRVAGRQVALRCSLMDSPTTRHRDREVQLTASNGWGAPTGAVCRHGRLPEPVRTTMPAVADVATELPTTTQDPTAGQETSRNVAAVVEICWLDQTAPPLSVVSTTPCPDLAPPRVVEVVPTTVQRTPATPTVVVVGVVVSAGVVVVVVGTVVGGAALVADPIPVTGGVDEVGVGAVVAGAG